MTVTYDMVNSHFIDDEDNVQPEIREQSPAYTYPELQLQLVEHSLGEKKSLSLPADLAYRTFIVMPE